MTKEQFLFQLEQKLLDIPEDERAEAMEYYRDYFNDAGSENEEQVIAELGSPDKVAASIKEGLRGGRDDAGTVGQPPQTRGAAQSYSEASKNRKQTDSRSKWILIILVAVFTFPFWIGAVGVIFGVLVAVVATIFGLLVAAVALAAVGIVAGLICFIVGIVRFFTGGLVSGLMTVSAGLLLFAMGCLCTAALIFVLGQVIPWMLRGISNLLHNGFHRRKKVDVNE
ncbi:MAG: DUF1700 domain-containing protein [Eubacterium sp.]|nr:DUF1700 domain-containing protein [Eubacterium sp.]